MMIFWGAAALTIVLVLVLLFRPFIWKTVGENVSRRQLNAAIYRDQLLKLDRDRSDNLLADADYLQARAELQRRVIEEASEEDAVAAVYSPKKTLWVIGVALPILTVGLYLFLGSPATLDGSAQQKPATRQDVDKMIATLAEKLEKDPSDLKGWAMLARSYQVLGRPVEAEQAFVRAGSFVDDDAQLLAIYADIAATNAKGQFAGKPMQLIEKALKVDPANPMALWLAGTAAYRSGDYKKTVALWERLSAQLAPESDDARMLQESLAEVYAKMGKAAPKTGAAASVSGEVDLDAALKAKAAPTDMVMVIARVPGTRMPVAVLRARASELPLKFTLDDSLSMSPQALISTAAEVDIEARISKSGMAQPESGDLITAVQTVKLGARGIKLHVAQVRP